MRGSSFFVRSRRPSPMWSEPAITLEDFGVQITFKAIDTAGEDGWVYTERTSGLVEAPGLGSKDDELLSSEWNIYFLICVHASFLH
jgi:hypothetical protein